MGEAIAAVLFLAVALEAITNRLTNQFGWFGGELVNYWTYLAGGLVAWGAPGLRVLSAFGVDAEPALDFVATAFVIGGGSSLIHELIASRQ